MNVGETYISVALKLYIKTFSHSVNIKLVINHVHPKFSNLTLRKGIQSDMNARASGERRRGKEKRNERLD